MASNESALAEVGYVARVLACALVPDKDEVLVLVRQDGSCLYVQVTTDVSQLGRLIGRDGQTARALRRVLTAIASKYSIFCDVNIGPFAAEEKGGK